MHWTSWGRPDITIERVAINIDDAKLLTMKETNR